MRRQVSLAFYKRPAIQCSSHCQNGECDYGRVVTVLAGQPDDSSWPSVHSEAAELLERTRPLLTLNKRSKQHRRGHFSALSYGISHGGGQTSPGNLSQEAHMG